MASKKKTTPKPKAPAQSRGSSTVAGGRASTGGLPQPTPATSTGPAPGTTAVPGIDSGNPGTPVRAPSGGKLYHVAGPNGGTYALVYDVGDGVSVRYAFDTPGMMVEGVPPPIEIDPGQFNTLYGPNSLTIDAGSVRSLGGIEDASYGDWFNRQFNLATGGAQWTTDPDLRKLYAEIVAGKVHPDSNEIEVRYHQSKWFQSHDELQQKWSDPATSNAEKQFQIQTQAKTLADTYFQMTGQVLPLTDPTLQQYATEIASGGMTDGQVIEQWIKPQALNTDQSPYQRELQKEQQDERQRSADVANQMGRLNQLYMQYGFVPDPNRIKQQATDIIDNKSTEEDITQTLKDQALSKYPGYNPNMTVEQWAQPWTDTYSRLLEKAPDRGLFDPTIQKFMTDNTPLYQAEQELKSRPDWLYTNNAKQDIFAGVGGVAKQMGFE